MRRAILSLTCGLAASLGLNANAGADGPDAEAVRKQIQELKAPTVAWRSIPWRSCLLDGLREARREGKPVLLWVFIDRPVDDARC